VRQTINQFFIGSVLLCVLMALDRRHLRELCQAIVPNSPKTQTWVKLVTKIALSMAAAACLLDPLVPGCAHLTVRIGERSNAFPPTSLMSNLRLRVVPEGMNGQAGGDRIEHVPFDATGSTEVTSKLTFLETAVSLEVYDQTRPAEALRTVTVYVSPFVRQGMMSKTFTF
jgi:hypothetical protein